jgi:hypothetical protein
MKKYPECEKMAAVQKESQAVGEFLDWLQSEKGFIVCEQGKGDSYEFPYVPACLSIESLLADFFGINLKKVEKERRDMLASLREKK